MAKIALLVAAALWLAERPGFVRVEWLDYNIRIHIGLFATALLFIILLSIFIYSTIKAFVDFPKSYRRYKEIKRFEDGYNAITLGLTAVAAGDGKVADYQAQRAEKFLPGDTGLPMLLKAQAARMQGREQEAQKAFAALLGDKNASFLGVRGLLQAELDKGNTEGALSAARKAQSAQPKQPWILKLVYDLEIKQKLWIQALETLKKLEKIKALSPAHIISERVAILHVQAQDFLAVQDQKNMRKCMQKALSLNPNFVPTVLALAQIEKENGQNRKAIRMILKLWKNSPHPDLARLWDEVMPPDYAKKPMGRMQWSERLLKFQPQSAIAFKILGLIATQEGLWGEARGYFERAQAIEPDSGLYYGWAALEEKSSKDALSIQKWIDKAAHAPAEKKWVCTKTGRIYEQWEPIASPHGSFNTIEWISPPQDQGLNFIRDLSLSRSVIEAPT